MFLTKVVFLMWTLSHMVRSRDGKNSHGDGYLWGFFLFGEGMRIILYPISYLGKGRRNFLTQFLIQGGDGDEVESPSPTHLPILIYNLFLFFKITSK